MDIVNELAMLNKYWTKNNVQKSNEQTDFESSISIDGSRTSENKLNDFVDFESSVSVDGSRCDESKLNDFIDYESSVDYCVLRNNVVHYKNVEKTTNSDKIVTLGDDDNDEDDDDDDGNNNDDDDDADDERDNHQNEAELDRCNRNSRLENDTKTNEASLIVWSEEENETNENIEGDVKEDEDNDDLNNDIREYMIELCKQKEQLGIEKNLAQERYQKLYEHVLKVRKQNK